MKIWNFRRDEIEAFRLLSISFVHKSEDFIRNAFIEVHELDIMVKWTKRCYKYYYYYYMPVNWSVVWTINKVY